MSDTLFFPFPERELGGAIAVNVFAVLSTFAFVSVAVRIVWLAIRQKLSDNGAEPEEYIFFNTQLGHYAACLLVANMFSGVSGSIGLFWTVERGITQGGLCTTQAILMQIGTWSTAYFTVSIAIHTFNSLVLRKRQSVLISAATISVGWITAGILAAGPFINPQFYDFGPAYGADGLSCGVRSVYLKAQFFFHLFPIFVASVLSAILYSLIFLVLRGTLNIKGGIKLTLDPHERWVAGKVTENYHRFVARIARSMLWYPIAYIALLVPYSVMRLLVISGFTVAFESMIFAFTCWFMLGIVNVLLLYNTFRILGPAFDAPSQRESSLSFGTNGQFARYSPSLSNEQQRSFDEKVEQYRYPTPSYRSPTPEAFTQVSSQISLRPLLPVHQERSASVQSFYSYPSSPSIGRAITPVSDLQSVITPPESATNRFSPSDDHSRRGLSDSTGLPAAPRRTRSPVLHQPSIEQIRSPVVIVNGSWTPMRPGMPRQPSSHTLGRRDSGSRYSSSSAFSADLESSNWSSLQVTGGLSPNAPFGHPMFSAVNSGFATPHTPGSPSSPRPLPNLPRHSRSFSAVPAVVPAPTGRQRAVLVSRHGSIGNSAESGHVRITSSQAKIYHT
ncbi:hypothetical protein Hypma_006851 [Hypsizygus marmoreus]|uniref:G-protein coupled receptors family 1 profile domain-containing protein n=1 Tax=Hypsizygus marmoreus TaxID=39966 RepID=A0A369K3N6_HYPMA|nr:hypothetical protein Hypma_006851 [Hypsizygus marmoreus]